MKNFKINNMDWKNWIENNFYNAIDVIRFIERENLQDYEISWKTPVTGEYKTLIRVENGIKTYETDLFKLPSVFKKIK